MSMFAQRHYVAMAELISAQRHKAVQQYDTGHDNMIAWDAVFRMAVEMAARFRRDNSKFKTYAFFKACGFGDTRIAEACDELAKVGSW